MHRRLVIGAVLIAAAPALADPLPVVTTPGTAAARHVTQLFMSPAGEPFRAYPDDPYPVEVWFKRADTDKDGALSLAEFKADAQTFFRKVDRDGNGVIDDSETSYYEKSIAPEILEPFIEAFDPSKAPRQPKWERNPDGTLPTTEASGSRISHDRKPLMSADAAAMQARRGAARFSFLNEPQPIRACDSNLDYKVTLAEWLNKTERRFATLDLNHDGKLERDELPVTPFQFKLLSDKSRKKK